MCIRDRPNDRIAVCISGGKDSMLMAKLIQMLHRHSKFPFEVKFLVMDPGYSPATVSYTHLDVYKRQALQGDRILR